MKKSQARLLRDALTDKSVLVPEAVKFEAIRKYLRNSRWAYAAEVCDTYQSKKETKLVLDIEDALLVLRSANGSAPVVSDALCRNVTFACVGIDARARSLL